MKVAAKTKDKPTLVEVEYDFGDGSLKGLVEKFGEDVVTSRAMSALVIDLQALMRREIESKDFTVEKLKDKVSKWKPTVVTAIRRSATEKLEDTVAKMDPMQKAELLKKLQAQLAGTATAAPSKPAPVAAAAGKK